MCSSNVLLLNFSFTLPTKIKGPRKKFKLCGDIGQAIICRKMVIKKIKRTICSFECLVFRTDFFSQILSSIKTVGKKFSNFFLLVFLSSL